MPRTSWRCRASSIVRAALVSLAAVLLATPAQAQARRVGALRGVVVTNDSSRTPVPLVDVYISAFARFTRSDSSGQFFIGDLPNGSYELRARRLGFEPIVRQLEVNAADTVEYEVAMTPLAQLVAQVDVVAPAVPVTPKLTPEERNRRASMGHFITREQLEKMGDRRLSELLFRFNGLQIIHGRRGQAWVAITGSRAGRMSGGSNLSSYDLQQGADANACYASIVIDRNTVYAGRPGEVLFDVDRLGAYMVEELEWFNSNAMVPAQYQSFGTTCGLLIIRLSEDERGDS